MKDLFIKDSLFLCMMVFVCLFSDSFSAAAKERSSLNKNMTIVCTGRYQGIRYFKDYQPENFQGEVSEDFNAIIIDDDFVKKQLLQKCQNMFAQDEQYFELDQIKIAGVFDKAYMKRFKKKLRSLNQMSSEVLPLKIKGNRYFPIISLNEKTSIEASAHRVSAHVASDPEDLFNYYSGDKQEDVSYLKLAKYYGSLSYTHESTDHLLTENTWFNEIIMPANFNIKGKLYLGALPLVDKNDPKRNYLAQIYDLGVSRVLSLVEPFELQVGIPRSFGFKELQVVSMSTWKNLGVDQLLLPSEDFKPVSAKLIQESVDYIADGLNAGEHVYVHCKAGRGRSATAVVAYLMATHGMSYRDAYALVKASRPQIHLNAKQRVAAEGFGGKSKK